MNSFLSLLASGTNNSPNSEEMRTAKDVGVSAGALLTAPLALEGGLAEEHGAPNVIQRVISLFKNVRPGSDLTLFQLPASFNMPKSQLQLYGEGVYCVGEDLLGRCVRGRSSVTRFVRVLGWSISTTRPPIFGLAPFNPVLGETHHVSTDSGLNILLEQVSHHPPVSALHATHAVDNIELIWCHTPSPKFQGTCIEAVITGKRHLKLLDFGEIYEMNSPNLIIRFLPMPSTEWAGEVAVTCKKSGLRADLCYYKSNSNFIGMGGNPCSIKGKIVRSESGKILYHIQGEWDGIVTLKDARSGETEVLYDAKKAIRRLTTPTVRDPKGLWETESAVVWGGVSRALMAKEWERASEAKRSIEERERAMRKARVTKWSPKHFTVKQQTFKEGGWECWPRQKIVPQAPIVVVNNI